MCNACYTFRFDYGATADSDGRYTSVKPISLRLLGMTNYSRGLHPASQKLHLHCETSPKVTWCSSNRNRKKILSEAPLLKFFNPEIPPVLQCDASINGLGVCFMGHPTSRSLTTTEANYAQIEKELLAVVFGM